MQNTSPIVGISTALGNGGIAIVRISGYNFLDELNPLFKIDLKTLQPNTINYTHLIENNHYIDEVLVSYMQAPHSFTGEDILEINCHGGILITQKIFKIILKHNIRAAEAGEFTKRAFLNNKKDLIQANSIMDMINAKSERALQYAQSALSGETTANIEALRGQLLKIISYIEVAIDYPEYEVDEMANNNPTLTEISNLINQLEIIIKNSTDGLILTNSLKVAIIGRPNVGKSSLINYLAKSEVAIVTDIAGTTRDVIERELLLGDLLITLIDTAGIQESNDFVEQIGIEKSRAIIDTVDLILLMVDGSQKVTELDLELLELTTNKKRLVIINKADMTLQPNSVLTKLDDTVTISAKSGFGIEAIAAQIKIIFNINDLEGNPSQTMANAEVIGHLTDVLNHLQNAAVQIEQDVAIDIVEIEIKEALYILGEIIGLNPRDNLIDELFSKFCLGK